MGSKIQDLLANLLFVNTESTLLSTYHNFVNTRTRTLWTVQAVRDRVAKSKGETKMNKNQNPTSLKVRQACDWPLSTNHNETALKVRKGLPLNHNESTLKVHMGADALNPNHNETALKVRQVIDPNERSNHNETALRSK
jgi:hypothetical protein